jgi:hypothetical protein
MKTMPDWLSRAAALPARLHGIDGSQITSTRGIDDPSGLRVIPVFTRHDFVTTSCRAAISFVVRECRSAGD